jgi:endonuclease YncB( thermonuclease family)
MEHALGSTVSLQVQAVDRYGRRVAEVIGKGTVNLAMVQSGQAFVYRQYLGRCDRQAYLAAERQAQAQRLGVWAVPGGGDYAALGVQAWGSGAPQRRGGPSQGILKPVRH